MRPKIDSEPTFDPLQLFRSEDPVEGNETTNADLTRTTDADLTRQRPMFVPVDDHLLSTRRPSRAARFGRAAFASLACGVVVGFASGYLSAQWLTTPFLAVPTLDAPSPRTAPEPSVAGGPAPNSDAVERAPAPSVPQSQSRELPVAPQAQSAPDRENASPPVEPRVPVATALRAREGSIEIMSRPAGADVSLDGQVIGQTPLTVPNVREGTHVIAIELAGFSRWATSVTVEAGKPARIGASLTP